MNELLKTRVSDAYQQLSLDKIRNDSLNQFCKKWNKKINSFLWISINSLILREYILKNERYFFWEYVIKCLHANGFNVGLKLCIGHFRLSRSHSGLVIWAITISIIHGRGDLVGNHDTFKIERGQYYLTVTVLGLAVFIN